MVFLSFPQNKSKERKIRVELSEPFFQEPNAKPEPLEPFPRPQEANITLNSKEKLNMANLPLLYTTFAGAPPLGPQEGPEKWCRAKLVEKCQKTF